VYIWHLEGFRVVEKEIGRTITEDTRSLLTHIRSLLTPGRFQGGRKRDRENHH
jgi:hypothetical protein